MRLLIFSIWRITCLSLKSENQSSFFEAIFVTSLAVVWRNSYGSIHVSRLTDYKVGRSSSYLESLNSYFSID